MKWFKHDSDANMDARLQEVLLDYGLEGYGLYWYCLELITNKVDASNITFELEHDSRVIARNTGSSVQKVQEMMTKFIDLGLFESSDGIVTCLKLAKRLDKSMTNSPKMREFLDNVRERHDTVSKSQPRIDKKENRKEEEKNNSASLSWPEFMTKTEISEIKELKRKATKQKLTPRAQKLLCKELEILNNAGYTMEQVLNTWAEFPHWKTFKADYIIGKQAPAGQSKRTTEKREQLAVEKTPEQKAKAQEILGALRT